jgi:integrase
MSADTGAFLDFIAQECLSALYTLTAYCGLRRDDVLGLRWTEVDLDEGSADVFETGSGNGPKSESGKRTVPLPAPVTDALRTWREQQDVVHRQDLRHAVPGDHEERCRGGRRRSSQKASQCQQRPAPDALTSVRASGSQSALQEPSRALQEPSRIPLLSPVTL